MLGCAGGCPQVSWRGAQCFSSSSSSSLGLEPQGQTESLGEGVEEQDLCGSSIPFPVQIMKLWLGRELGVNLLPDPGPAWGRGRRTDGRMAGWRGLGRSGHNSSGFSNPPPECL